MKGVVAAAAENGGSKDRLRLSIDDDLHEALRLTLLNGARAPGYRSLADAHRISLGTRLRFGQADAPERRVDVEGITRDPVAHPAVVPIQQIGGDNLEVVVGRVGEGATAVAVTQRPDV